MGRKRAIGAGLLLMAASVVYGQPAPQQPAPPVLNESQRLIQAVREGDESAVFELIKTSAGRQELLALSDTYVFEIRVAKLLRSSLPQKPEDRKAVRQMELSLLRQTSDEGVVNELFVGLLAREPQEVTTAPAAIKLADALYDEMQRDLNDEVTKNGKVIKGGKSKVMVQTAESIVKTVTDPARVAFFRRILTRVRDDPDQLGPAQALVEPVKPEPAPAKEPSAAALFWAKALSVAAAVLLGILVIAIVWRISKFRPSAYVAPARPPKNPVAVQRGLADMDQEEGP